MQKETKEFMYPRNTKNEKREELFETLAKNRRIVIEPNGEKRIQERGGEFLQEQIEGVLDIAMTMSLTYSELETFLELVKLTASDYRVIGRRVR